MMKNTFCVEDLTVGKRVSGCLLLKTAKTGIARNGSPYLSATLADTTGEIAAVVWENYSGITASDAGRIVRFSGEVSEYNGQPQLVVNAETISLVTNNDDIHAVREDLVPVAPQPSKAMADELYESMYTEITDTDYLTFCEALLLPSHDEFVTTPAAMHVHHSFISGLLMHTNNIVHMAKAVADRYGNRIDRSLLIAGAILHDYGKLREFQLSEIGLVSDYTTEGQLIGHSVIGALQIAEIAQREGIPHEKAMLLEHMLLAHHGQPEHGATVRPAIIEAEILSQLDMLDSCIEIYFENLQSVEKDTFSDRVWALENTKIYNHG